MKKTYFVIAANITPLRAQYLATDPADARRFGIVEFKEFEKAHKFNDKQSATDLLSIGLFDETHEQYRFANPRVVKVTMENV